MQGRGRGNAVQGRGNAVAVQGRGNIAQGRGNGRIREICKGCNRELMTGQLGRHINQVHRHGGPNPKTSAEMNLLEGGEINRWITCPVEGCFMILDGQNGLNRHNNMHLRAEAPGADVADAAANEEEEEAGNNVAAAAGNNNNNNNNGNNEDNDGEDGGNVGPNGGVLGDILRQAGYGPNGEVVRIDYGYVLAQNRKGLYTTHPTWIPYMDKITVALINMICEGDATREYEGAVALMLLPGVMTKMMAQGKKKTPTIDQLRSIDGSNNRAKYIIEQALHLNSIMPPKIHNNEEVHTIERTRAQVEELFKDGRISACRRKIDELEKRMQHIVPGVGPTEEEYGTMIQRLFPDSSDLDILPTVEEVPYIENLLQLSADHIQKKGETMKTDSSAGISAWTPKTIHRMLDQRGKVGHNAETGPAPIHHALARLINKMLKNELSDDVRDLFCESRLCWVDKKDIPGARPISMDCALLRFLYNCCKGDLDKKLMVEMGDTQLAIGERDGTEILGRLLDAAYQAGKTVTMLDAENAYGNTKRGALFDELNRVAPEYLALYRFQYGGKRKIRNNQGVVVKETETSLKQGCPLSGDYYMLASGPLLKRLNDDRKESEEEIRSQGEILIEGGTYGYLDDIYLINDAKVTGTNTPKLAPAYDAHNGILCVAKSEITGTEVYNHDDVPANWKISQDGGVAVGVPFGDRHWKIRYIKEELEKRYPPKLALSILTPRLVVALIVLSYSKRASYLIKTSNNLLDVLPLAELFDRAMVEALANVARVNVTDVIRAIINLPQRYGGAGLEEVGGLAAEAGQLSGAMKAKAFITENCTPEQIQELTAHINTDIILGTSQQLIEATEIENVTYDTMTAITASRILWKGKDNAQRHKADMLIAELGSDAKTRQHAVALLSKRGSAGCKYLLSGLGRGSSTFFPAGDFTQVLRYHLGQQVTNNEPAIRKRPQGGARYETASNPAEPLVDVLNQQFMTRRHMDVQRVLLNAMRKMKPGDYIEPNKEVGSIVTVNEGRPDNATPVIGDIIWMDGPEKVIIELSGIVPEANTYMQRWDTFMTQDAAAEGHQIKKKVKYGKVNRINGESATIPADSVIPFVFEASGRLGPAAFSFINRVFQTQTYRRSQLISEIALICSRFTGKMLAASRDRYLIQAHIGG
jgi:hypothetical protein